MKKLSLITLFLLATSFIVYYFFFYTEVSIVETITPSKMDVQKKVDMNKQVESLEPKADEDFESAQFDKYLARVEDEWNKSIEELFLDQGAKGERNLNEYLKLKNGYEQEREKRYEAFHEMMEAKYGPNYSYSPSADEEMFNEKLVKIYEKNLAKIIGKKKMIKYMKVKDTFNQKLEEESKDDNSYILIEF